MRLKIKLTIFGIFLLLCLGCNDTPPDNEIKSTWTVWEFPDKKAYTLRYFEPYLYVCAFKNGLWRMDLSASDSTWEYVAVLEAVGTSRYGIQDVVFDPITKSLLVARPSEDPLEHSLFRSQDGGQSWIPSDSGMVYGSENEDRDNILVLRKFETTLFAGGNRVYRSDDGGLTWEMKTGAGSTVLLEQDPNHPNTIWLVGELVVLMETMKKSTDFGETWTQVILDPVDLYVWEIAFTHGDTDRVYLATDMGLIYTQDGGQSWSKPVVVDSANTDYVSLVWADPDNSRHLIVGLGNRLYESIDRGRHWSELETPIINPILSYEYDPATNTLFIGTDSYVYAYKLMAGEN